MCECECVCVVKRESLFDVLCFLFSTSLYKGPWARVFVYRGHRIKKTGFSSKQEVVSYPRDIGSSGDPTDRYTPVIVPADLVHVRVGISPPPGMIVSIHGLPPQLLLAIAYIETLVSSQFPFLFTKMDYDSRTVLLPGRDDNSTKSDDARSSGSRLTDSTLISSSVLLRIIELLTGYLGRTDVPAPIKEIVFHLLGQTLRLVYQSEIGSPSSVIVPNLSPAMSGSKALFAQLQLEVCRLYEEESKSRSQAEKQNTCARYSTYLQSLVELCLAVAEVTAPILSTHASSTDIACSPSASSDMLSPDLKGSVTALLGSPSKRKKIKAKRERGSSTPKRGASPRRTTSESDSPMSASPHTSASTGALMPSAVPSCSGSTSSVLCTGSKQEEQLWFHRALTMSQILRYLVRSDPVGHLVTMDAVADASVLLTDCTAHTRLIVLSNMPTAMNARSVRTALYKAVASSGGFFMEDFYLPVEECPRSRVPVGPTAPQKDAAPTGNREGKGQSEETDLRLKGHAVLQLRCKSKLESALKAITKAKLSVLSELLEPGDLADLPEEVFTVSTVNPMLFTTDQGNPALETYLLEKIVTSRATYDLCDGAVVALTEVFHSCFIVLEQRMSVVSEEKPTHGDSGYIYLTAEQIMMAASANLMFAFFVTTRPQKKSLLEHVTQVLRRYGVQKVTDKEELVHIYLSIYL